MPEPVVVATGESAVTVAGDRITLTWRGRTVLRGGLRTQSRLRSTRVVARVDGDAVYIEVQVEPLPTAAVAAVWLELLWVADTPGPLRAWVPHLRPGPDDVIADHSFRSPVAAIEDGGVRVVLLPDVDLLTTTRSLPGAFDLDLTATPAPRIAYGLCASRPHGHTWFRSDPAGGTTQLLHFGLRVVAESATEQPMESSCARRVWGTVVAGRTPHARTQALPFADHGARAYAALVADEWLETEIGGVAVGGPIHYGDSGTAVFFQAWYNALRSAIGLALLGKRLGRADYFVQAQRVAALVDAMPNADLLPTFYDHERHRWWGVSDDLIFSWIGRDDTALRFYHLPDVCETAKWMLAWHELVDPRPSFIGRVRRLARFLASVQAEDGSIPSYFDQGTLKPGPHLRSAAQSAIAGPILLYGGYHDAAVRLAEFLHRAVVPSGRYFDYETFLSCSYKPFDFTDPHTGIAPQNTLSMGWTAEYLLQVACSRVGTPEQRVSWRAAARQALDQLCLYQQLWEPPFLSYRSFGGFGVMNTDGEWSDARQALFGGLLLDAYQVFRQPEYFTRGVAALRAAFALQAIPENRSICPTAYDGSCPNWPRSAPWDFRWDRSPTEMQKLPPGKSIENYGHGGHDSPGVRSGFDWGEGSAAAGALIATHRYGDVFIDPTQEAVWGIDGVQAVRLGDGFEIQDIVDTDRDLSVRIAAAEGLSPPHRGESCRPGARIIPGRA